MNERDNFNGNFLQISRGELEALYHDFAELLVMKGKTDEDDLDEDGTPLREIGTPHNFKFIMNGRVVKEIFLSDTSEDNLVATGGYVEYSPYRAIEEPPFDQQVESLFMSVDSHIKDNPEILRHMTITISRDEAIGSGFKADVAVEYVSEGKSLSRGATTQEGTLDEQLQRAVESYDETTRELTFGDLENLRRLMDLIHKLPHQRDA